jgi:hypothetical protein
VAVSHGEGYKAECASQDQSFHFLFLFKVIADIRSNKGRSVPVDIFLSERHYHTQPTPKKQGSFTPIYPVISSYVEARQNAML